MIIYSIAAEDAAVWLGTSRGLWRGGHGAWTLIGVEQPVQALALTVAVDPARMWAGGALGIVGGVERGEWQPAWIDEVEAPITCLAVAPGFAEQRALLAGTDGAGVLRSTDGGAHWWLSGAGLRERAVLALASLPAAGREIVFAATTGGLYRSPNGGRAWKLCAGPLAGDVVQAIAATSAAIYAGTEAGTLCRSADEGARWQPLPLPAHGPINALWAAPSDPALLVAGTGAGALLRSADGGASWTSAEAPDAVLALAGGDTRLYAGCADGSLLVSSDSGRTWTLDPSWSRRLSAADAH